MNLPVYKSVTGLPMFHPMREKRVKVSSLKMNKVKAMAHSIFMCRKCGHIYDEANSEREAGIPSGTDFDELPDDWRCPECGADKEQFEKII